MTAAHVAAQLAAIGLREDASAAGVALLWCAPGLAAMAAATWWLRRRSRRVPLMPLPPVGDDTVDMVTGWHDKAVDEELDQIITEGEKHNG